MAQLAIDRGPVSFVAVNAGCVQMQLMAEKDEIGS
jgi:hypothetical protein